MITREGRRRRHRRHKRRTRFRRGLRMVGEGLAAMASMPGRAWFGVDIAREDCDIKVRNEHYFGGVPPGVSEPEPVRRDRYEPPRFVESIRQIVRELNT